MMITHLMFPDDLRQLSIRLEMRSPAFLKNGSYRCGSDCSG